METANAKLRGMLSGTNFTAYTVGIFWVYTLSVWLKWDIVALCCSVIPVISIIYMFFIPESPTWLVRQNKIEKAKRALLWLRGGDVDKVKALSEKIKGWKKIVNKRCIIVVIGEWRSGYVSKPSKSRFRPQRRQCGFLRTVFEEHENRRTSRSSETAVHYLRVHAVAAAERDVHLGFLWRGYHRSNRSVCNDWKFEKHFKSWLQSEFLSRKARVKLNNIISCGCNVEATFTWNMIEGYYCHK